MTAKPLAKVFKQITAFWNRFSRAERHQIVGAICFMIALCYGLFLWQPNHKKLGDLVYKEQKQKARERKTKEADKALQNLNLNGVDMLTVSRDLTQVRASLAVQMAELKRLLTRFTPIEDLETLQSLKSDITRLAENGDMEIIALEHIYRDSEARKRPPTPELLRESSMSNPYKRPLLRLKARASYQGLMAFLDGLPKLPRVAAPVWSDIGVKVGSVAANTQGTTSIVTKAEKAVPGNPMAAPPKQWLEVEIHLAI